MSDLPGSIASRITVDPVSGCWKVAGNLDKSGYARIVAPEAERLLDPDADVDEVIMAAFANGWRLGLLAGAEPGTAA